MSRGDTVLVRVGIAGYHRGKIIQIYPSIVEVFCNGLKVYSKAIDLINPYECPFL